LSQPEFAEQVHEHSLVDAALPSPIVTRHRKPPSPNGSIGLFSAKRWPASGGTLESAASGGMSLSLYQTCNITGCVATAAIEIGPSLICAVEQSEQSRTRAAARLEPCVKITTRLALRFSELTSSPASRK
jgi:hypothetical protein